jgi:hypothetical protein
VTKKVVQVSASTWPKVVAPRPRRSSPADEGWICPPCEARLCSRCTDFLKCRCKHLNPVG